MGMRLGIIGYGEAGRAFGAGLAAAGADVAAHDILLGRPAGETMAAQAQSDGVAVCETSAAAIRDADIVLSFVPADAVRTVAEDAARTLTSGQCFIDMNSVSPREKKIGAAVVSASGADYVEATIMAPVSTAGAATEVLLAGPAAATAAERLSPLGMNVAVVGDQYGAAATVKLCRSVVIKGMEAILLESLLAARRFGADTAVLASLQKSDPETDWTAKADYVFERVLQHGRRRAAEMRFAGQAVADAGYPPLMSEAIAALQDSIADFSDADPTLAALPGYAAAADRIGQMLDQAHSGPGLDPQHLDPQHLDVDDLMAEEET